MFAKLKQYGFNLWCGFKGILLSADREGNAITGGDPRETMSSRVGRYQNQNAVAEEVADVLDTVSPGHVERAEAGNEPHDWEILK